MNPRFVEGVMKRTPAIDPRIGLGLAYHLNSGIPQYVSSLFSCNASRFPTRLKYVGYREATPYEGYAYMTRVLNNSRFHDINKNDIRLYCFMFRWEGPNGDVREINKYIYLPFIRRHGFMYMNGVKYIVVPVMADGVMTIKPTEVFIKLIKTKLWFEKINNVPFVVDGEPEYTNVYTSKIHNKNSKNKQIDSIKMKPILYHYLFCKYGVSETFRQLHGHSFRDDVVCFNKSKWDEISEQYPREEWVIIESLGKKPNKTYLYPIYNPSNIAFLIRRELYEDPRFHADYKNFFGSMYYVLDHYTSEHRMNPNMLDDVGAWRSMMGEVIVSSLDHVATIKSAIEKHMVSLDGYVDDMVRSEFDRSGIHDINSVYDLFLYIIKNFTRLTGSVMETETANSLYYKQLQVYQFLLFDLTKSINNVYFELSSLRLEEERDPSLNIKVEAIVKILDGIRPNVVMQIKNHGEIIVVDDPTDLPLLKLGRMVTTQEKSDKAKTSRTPFNPNSPTSALHESILEVGAAFDMPKSDPSGKSRLNPHVMIDDQYRIIPNPELKEIMDATRKLLYKK